MNIIKLDNLNDFGLGSYLSYFRQKNLIKLT